jgi:precorrin-3B synthase
MNAPHRRGACPGLTAPMQTGDGLLVRLATGGGTITLDAMAALCAAARHHGNGIIEITARGSIQIRGLTPASAQAFADTVAMLAIDASDGVPIVTDPLAGLAPAPSIDSQALASALRQRLAVAAFTAMLGPKVSVVIDGGSALHLDAIRADIRLRATDAGWDVGIGGDADTATPIGAVATADAVTLVVRLLETIARHGPQARAREIIQRLGPGSFPAAISSPPSCGEGSGVGVAQCGTAEQSGTTPLPDPPPQGGREAFSAPSQRNRPASEPIGTHLLRDGRIALGIGLTFGHTDADALAALIETAKRAGAHGLRTAPGRALLVIGLAADIAPKLDAAAEGLGFIARRDDPRRHVVACAGAPICASAEIPARALAPMISTAAPALLDGSLTVHLSGCSKGCAHPAAATLTIVGGRNGCGLIIDGSARDRPGATIATAALAAGFARIAREMAPGETGADTLARVGGARIAAILGATRHE